MAISANEQKVLDRADKILHREIKERGEAYTSPEMFRKLMRLRLEHLDYEVFGVILLDNRHRLIEVKELFKGTIDGASVYPREVVKEALNYGSGAVIFYHNHPSGIDTPSEADKSLTRRLKEALAMVDVRVLDHFIVGSPTVYSFAENGLI